LLKTVVLMVVLVVVLMVMLNAHSLVKTEGRH